MTSVRNLSFSLNQAMAYVVGVPTMVLVPLFYWQYGNAFLGANGMTRLFLVTGGGGIVSFALYGGRRRWLIGGLLGLIGGLGAAGALLFYVAIFHKTSMMDKECALVCLAGAGPSMALLGYILRVDKRNLLMSRASLEGGPLNPVQVETIKASINRAEKEEKRELQQAYMHHEMDGMMRLCMAGGFALVAGAGLCCFIPCAPSGFLDWERSTVNQLSVGGVIGSMAVVFGFVKLCQQ